MAIGNIKTRVLVINPDSFGGIDAIEEAAAAGIATLTALVNPSDDTAVYRADSPAVGDAPSFYTSIIETYNPSKNPVLYLRYDATKVDFSYEGFIESYVGNGSPSAVDILILKINKLTVEVPGVGPVAISSTTNPEFKKTNAVKVDPAGAYWFEELHNANKAVVYYVTLSGKPAEETLSGLLAIATKIAPDAYVNPTDPIEALLPIFFKEIAGYEMESSRRFKADGSRFDDETDDKESIKYYVTLYVSEEG